MKSAMASSGAKFVRRSFRLTSAERSWALSAGRVGAKSIRGHNFPGLRSKKDIDEVIADINGSC